MLDKGRKSEGTDEPEIVGANLQGGGSGSGGEGTDLSYKQVQEADQMDDVSHLEKEFHSRGIRLHEERSGGYIQPSRFARRGCKGLCSSERRTVSQC